jgi:hypothetical protein
MTKEVPQCTGLIYSDFIPKSCTQCSEMFKCEGYKMYLEQIERNQKLKSTILDLVRYYEVKCGEINIEILKDMFSRLNIKLTSDELKMLDDNENN